MNTLSRTQRGLTLIETLVSLTISGLLSAQAIPSLREFQQRQRLESVTQSFVTDLQQARSLAVSQGESIQLHFSPQAGGSCYVLHTGKKGDCECDAAGHPVCIDPAQMIKASWLPNSEAVRLKSNSGHLVFAGRHGTVTPTASINLTSDSGASLRAVLSVAGRVRVCSPSGRSSGMPAC